MSKKVLQKLTAITTAAVLAASIAPLSASAAWDQDANSNWSWTENGQKATGWKWIHGNWYYFDGSGIMQTGWKYINGQWYYMDSSGAMKTGWQFIKGEWYHLGTNGAMTKGWYKEGSSWYHLNENGVMARHWRKISNVWYRFNPSGQMQTGWITYHDDTYFGNIDGAIQTGLVQIDNKVYYFREEADSRQGAMETGRIQIGDRTYTFGDDGAATGALLPEAEIAYDANGNEKTPGGVVSGGDTTPSRPSGGGGSWSGGGSSGGGSSYIDAQSLTLNKTSLDLNVGDSALLTATIYPLNATNKVISWSSSDTSIATVNNGRVYALKEGTVTITAYVDEVKASCTVRVAATAGEEIKVTGITVTSTSGSDEVHVGEGLQLQAAVTPDDATNKAVTWSSSDTDIATVDANGLVTGVAEGTATITATAADGSGVTGTFEVTVTEKPETESATPTFTTNLKTSMDVTVGDEVTLSVAATASDGGTLTYQWYKDDEAISGATSASYTFTADAAGSASYKVVVTNTKDDLTPASATSATCVVTATEAGEFVAVTDITDVPTDATVGIDLALTGTVAPANATNKTIVWTVKDEGETGATIDGSTLKTTAAGTVTVTATITNGTAEGTDFTKDFTITVSEAAPSEIPYTATGTPEVKFVNGFNDEENLAKVSYADGKFTVAGDVTSFSFVDGGVAKQFTNTGGVWSDAVEISNSLIFGESFTTDINRDNFGYFSATYDNPMFFTSLTDGVVPPSADCNQFGYVTMATTRPEGINKDICFNLDDEITFSQINIDLMKQTVWAAEDGYPEHVTIEANIGGVWAAIADVTGLDISGTDGTAKTLVFTSEAPITASGLRFTFYARQGTAKAIILTGIDVLATADGSPADGTLEVPSDIAETPVITTDLEASKTVEVGETVELSVEASVSDGGTLMYQWYKNDEPIQGATSSTYSFPTFAAETATYKVEVTNTKEGMLPSKVTSTACVVSAVTDLVNIAKGASYTFTSPEGLDLNFSGSASDDGVKLTDDFTPNTTIYGDAGFVTFHVTGGSETSTVDVVIDLGAAKSFERVTIDTLKSTDGVNPIETGMVSYSTDGSDWTEFGAINHTHGDVGVETIMLNAEEPVTARYVKVTLNGVSGWRSLAEIRVWGEAVFEAVTDITGVPTEATAGTDLELTGTVAPATATNQTIVWSVKDPGETGATIEGNVLKTTAAGTVTVTATITNGAAEDADFTKDFTITVKEAPVVTSDNLLAGKTWTSTTVTTQSLFDKPLSENASQWLTDGEKPVVDDYTEEFHANGGVVLFYHSTDKPLQSFVYDLEDGKNTFKQIQISTLYAAAGNTIVGSTPKTIKIEAEVNGEWVTLFENAEPYANANESKNFVFSSDTPITATQLRFSFAGQGREGAGIGWPGVALNEIEVLADAATGAIDGTLEAPEVPVESGNLLAGKTWTSTTVEAESYGDKAFVANANKWLTDGERPTPETIATATVEECGVVLFYNNENHPVQSFVYDLDAGKDTFKQIQISVLNQMKDTQQLGATPKTITIDAYIDGEWVTLFENEEPYSDLGENKNFVFSSDTAITASQLRFSFVAQGTGWPGIALNEIEVLADAATGAIDGTLEAPEAPVITGNLIAGEAYTSNFNNAIYAEGANGFHSDAHADYEGLKLTDGQFANAWGDETSVGFVYQGMPELELTYEFDDVKTFKEINLNFVGNEAGIGGINHLQIEAKIDGTWQNIYYGDIASVFDGAATRGDLYFTTDEAISAEGLRISMVPQYNMVFLGEIQVMAEKTADVTADGTLGLVGVPSFSKDLDESTTIALDGALELSVEANAVDNGDLTYQWYKDGVALDGENSPTLQKSNVTFDDAGSYYCVVTNTDKTTGLTASIKSITNTVIVKDADNIIGGIPWSNTPNVNWAWRSDGISGSSSVLKGWMTDGIVPESSGLPYDTIGYSLFNYEGLPPETADAGGSFEFVLGADKTFKQIAINLIENTSAYTTGVNRIIIEAEVGGTWQTLIDKSDLTVPATDVLHFTVAGGESITADKLRFTFFKSDAQFAGINEIEVRQSAYEGEADGELAVPEAPAYVAVTDITGVSTEATAGTDLALTGTVTPDNATNQTIVWSVKDPGETGATIDGSTLKTTAAGTVTVTATIVNGAAEGTDFTKEFTITVTEPAVVSDNLISGKAYTLNEGSKADGDTSPSGDPTKTKLTDGVRFADPPAYNDGNSVLFQSSEPDIIFTYELDDEITFKEINFGVLRWASAGIDGMTNLEIQAKIDGEWQTLYDANPSNATWDTGAPVTGVTQYFVSENPITATGIRLSMTRANAYIVLDEIEVKAEPTAGVDATGTLTVPEAPAFVAVTDITGVPTEAIAGTDLELTGMVTPDDATNKTVVWTVKDAGETGATIDGSTLKTTAAGTVTVTATVANGAAEDADFTKDFTITVNAAPVVSDNLLYGTPWSDTNADGWGYGGTTDPNTLTDGVIKTDADPFEENITFSSSPTSFTWDKTMNFQEVKIHANVNSNLNNLTPIGIKIEVANSGYWSTVVDKQDFELSSTGRDYVFTIADGSVQADQLRITFTKGTGEAGTWGGLSLSEVEVFATAKDEPDGTMTAPVIPEESTETPTLTTDLEASKTVDVNEPVELAVEATVSDGGTLTYQWYKNDVRIEGANSSTYTFTPFTTGTDTYKVEVTNSKEGMFSSTVTSTACVVEAVTDLTNIAKGASYTFASTEGLELNYSGSAVDDGIKLTDDITPDSTSYGDAEFVTFHVLKGSDASTVDVVIDLGAEKSFERVTIDTLKGADGVNPVETGMISYSTDGSDWTEFGAINHTHGDIGIETILVDVAEPVTGRYVKVTINKANGWRNLAEIRVWADESGNTSAAPDPDWGQDVTVGF